MIFLTLLARSLNCETHCKSLNSRRLNYEITQPILCKSLHTSNLLKQLYLNQKWDDAIKLFEKSVVLEDNFTGRNTNPSQVFIERCDYLKNNPPEPNWDGVWEMTSK